MRHIQCFIEPLTEILNPRGGCTLTFACYIGSLPPQKYQRLLAYPQKYLSMSQYPKNTKAIILQPMMLTKISNQIVEFYMDRVKRIWYLSPMRAAKVQASLRIRAVSPEPSLLAHTSRESRGTFRQKARSLAALNGWACAVKICHDGMLEDTNSLDGAHIIS